MNTIRIDLLRQLAQHLLTGQLGHKVFDFSKINYDGIDGYKTNSNVCLTMGCAAGEAPIVWPDKWKFHGSDVSLIESIKEGEACMKTFPDLQTFFGINANQSYHLFMPTELDENDNYLDEVSQIPSKYGGQVLFHNATKQEVAANIFEFCDKVEKGEIQEWN